MHLNTRYMLRSSFEDSIGAETLVDREQSLAAINPKSSRARFVGVLMPGQFLPLDHA